MVTAKGVRKWVRTIGVPTIEDGKVIRVHGSFQDISDSKAAELQMKESESRYYDLLEVAPVGIVVLEDDIIDYINPTGLAMLGAESMDQIVGQSYHSFLLPDRLTLSRDRISRMTAGEKGIYPIEEDFIRLDGSMIPVEVMATTLTYRGKKVVQALMTDITDRKKAQAVSYKLQLDLEQMVEIRTQQLTEANKELDAFTYTVSHDLKAPLRGIDGYSKLLMEENEAQLNEDGKYFIKAIRQSVLRMSQLINDLLIYSRIERKPWQPGCIDLAEQLQGLVKELGDEFLAGGGRININTRGATVKTSREGLYMVLRNLLENAIKYSPDIEHAVIEISVEETANSIIIQIKDNGIGFDLKYHDKIFNIFERLQRSEDYPGTGIGLAIVKKVAERLHGKVWATSQLGQGSTFNFEIPREV